MSSDSAPSSRTLRSRDPWGDKKRPKRTQPLRKSTRTVTSTKDNMSSMMSSGENRGRFRSKLTDTLKLKLIAQHPRNANHKKTTAKPVVPKPIVKKKSPPKPPVLVTQVKTDLEIPSVAPVMPVNGLSVVNNHHIPKSYILHISNLPVDITKEQLEDHFRKTGGVKSTRIPKEKGTEKGRGYAYMEFKDRISHGIALRLHQTKLAGRRINVEFTPLAGKKKDKLKRRLQALSRPKASPEKT
ncbi:uncharacterized protein [Haliotis cracherodii]|uniref:uncharacterized protein isoform X1 n=1 Tax=Haliotis cracherodii TaxID=6455 RepID=UPI0039E9F476